MKYLLLIPALLSFVFCFSQNDPVAWFSFDDCSALDEMGNYSAGSIRNSIDCECGVGDNSSALDFDGSGDTLQLDGTLKALFDNDFSIAFYLWMDNVTDITSIMSIQGACANARDSAFFIRYFPNSNEVVIEMSKNFGEIISLRTELPVNSCWNHILFTREGEIYSLYLNGQFIERFRFIDEVVLGQDYPFYIGVSPCVGINDQFLRGRIDEIKFFNYALKSEEQVLSVQQFPDRILTSDTTIFEGSTIELVTSPSCASGIQWRPLTGLDDPSSAMPMATPFETVEYMVEFDHGTCVSSDNIIVSVLSEDEIQCGNILLPKAFTPNNDGLNERYGISNTFIVEELQRFEIFNRWGMKIFETFNKNEMWDGRYNGQPQPPGTYVYKLEYTCQGNSFTRTSSFNLLK